jgi:hypothetical protein
LFGTVVVVGGTVVVTGAVDPVVTTVDFVAGTEVAEPFTNGTVAPVAAGCVTDEATVVTGALTTISSAGETVVVVAGGIVVVVVVEVVVVVGTAVTVMVTAPVVAELYVASAAFVAVTVHEPVEEVERTAPLSEHPAEPAEVSE